MDADILFELKSQTRKNMKKDGIISDTAPPPRITPNELGDVFFIKHPLIGIHTHEPEANYAGFHSHTHFEMVYVVSGSCTQQMDDGETIVLHKGNFCIMNPSVTHSLTISGTEDIVLDFALKPELFNSVFFSFFENENSITDFFINYLMAETTKNYMVFYNQYNRKTDGLIGIIINTYLEGEAFMGTEIKCLLIVLFAQILKNLPDDYTSPEMSKFSEIVNYIAAHIRDITLQSVAEHFNFHPNYLSSYIKKISGRTFSNILLELRVVQAKYYLSNTDLPISQIAQMLGYDDQPSFNAMFRKNVGGTPSGFRKFNTDIQT